MFLIDAIKQNVEKKFKTCLIFLTRLLREGESQAYKIKPFFFLAATKTLFKILL